MGKEIREIKLKLTFPWHAIQLSTDQYLVCHGIGNDGDVSVLNGSGDIVESYSHQTQSMTVRPPRLSWARYLSVDRDKFIYLIDWWGTDQILLLSPTLMFVRKLTPPG